MGYTHYWRRPLELEKEKFAAAIADCRKVLAYLSERQLALAGWDGTGLPVITDEEISFNGRVNCGHERGNFGIAWPADNAGGFAGSAEIKRGMVWRRDFSDPLLRRGLFA